MWKTSRDLSSGKHFNFFFSCTHVGASTESCVADNYIQLLITYYLPLFFFAKASDVQHLLRISRPELVHSRQRSHPLQLDSWGHIQCHGGLCPRHLFLPLPACQQLTEIWHPTGAQLLHWQLGKLAHHVHRFSGSCGKMCLSVIKSLKKVQHCMSENVCGFCWQLKIICSLFIIQALYKNYF